MGEVRARYPDVHVVARELGAQIEENLGGTIAEDEIGFLTMYLSGAMERARLRPRRRVLVVCPSGMATAWVLVSRIQAEFPEFDLVEVLSEGGYEALDHSDFDLVISTVAVREAVANPHAPPPMKSDARQAIRARNLMPPTSPATELKPGKSVLMPGSSIVARIPLSRTWGT